MCIRQLIAGSLQSQQNAASQQTLANKVRLLARELSKQGVTKYEAIDKVHIKSGSRLQADGTKVYPFLTGITVQNWKVHSMKAFLTIRLFSPQENFRKNTYGFVHLVSIAGDDVAAAIEKLESTCNMKLTPSLFRGAGNLIDPDVRMLLR